MALCAMWSRVQNMRICDETPSKINDGHCSVEGGVAADEKPASRPNGERACSALAPLRARRYHFFGERSSNRWRRPGGNLPIELFTLPESAGRPSCEN